MVPEGGEEMAEVFGRQTGRMASEGSKCLESGMGNENGNKDETPCNGRMSGRVL